MKKMRFFVVCLSIAMLMSMASVTGCSKKDKKDTETTETEVTTTVETTTVATTIPTTTTTVETTTEQTAVTGINTIDAAAANETIRDTLSDEEWVTKNLYVDYSSNDDKNFVESLLENTHVYIMKLSDIEGAPAYIILNDNGITSRVKVITYRDGEVVVTRDFLVGEYSSVDVNVVTNTLVITNDQTGLSTVYAIHGTELGEVAHYTNEDGKLTYYVYCDEATADDYKKFIDSIERQKFKKETTNELTADNISNIVK